MFSSSVRLVDQYSFTRTIVHLHIGPFLGEKEEGKT